MVLRVPETSGGAANEFDQPVVGFSAAVVRTAGGEVAQDRVSPLVHGPAQAWDFRDRASPEAGEDLLRDSAIVGVARVVTDRTQLVRAVPATSTSMGASLTATACWGAVIYRSVRCSWPAGTL